MRRCDYPTEPKTPCNEVANANAHFTMNGIESVADYCLHHEVDVQKVVITVGLVPYGSRIDGKPRALYTAASGTKFSAAEARAWLTEQDVDCGSGAGRLATKHIDQYAAAH